MPMDGRDKRNGTKERELVGDDAELAKARNEVEALRQLHQRIDQRQLEPGDWDLLRALIEETYDELESSDASLVG
ncbi:MAG: hypothetical protein ACHREM_28280 [Polyangiales bacterium]